LEREYIELIATHLKKHVKPNSKKVKDKVLIHVSPVGESTTQLFKVAIFCCYSLSKAKGFVVFSSTYFLPPTCYGLVYGVD
jgi:hypothetical protein